MTSIIILSFFNFVLNLGTLILFYYFIKSMKKSLSPFIPTHHTTR